MLLAVAGIDTEFLEACGKVRSGDGNLDERAREGNLSDKVALSLIFACYI
jgi:hypothetical protein